MVAVAAADPENAEPEARVRREFCWKHRKAKLSYTFEEGFPRRAVTQAYMEPAVDHSTEPFAWGRMDTGASTYTTNHAATRAMNVWVNLSGASTYTTNHAAMRAMNL